MQSHEQAVQNYRATWESKKPALVRREIESMRRYMEKNSRAYAWHGPQHAPEEMSDGERLSVLRQVLEDVQ